MCGARVRSRKAAWIGTEHDTRSHFACACSARSQCDVGPLG